MFFKQNYCNTPADVPHAMQKTYCAHYNTITQGTDNLFLLAYDQKIEHLNKDFYGPSIHADALHPEHIFTIASQGSIGALATHLGLIARYGTQYPEIPYIAKLNGKTDLISLEHQDPFSKQWWDVDDVLNVKKSGINICGVGLTIYLGSIHESDMMTQAAQTITQAHANGLIAIVWVYIRGKHINDTDPALCAGAAGVAASLDADFVKIKPPHNTNDLTASQWLAIASAAAGNTQVICAGGERTKPEEYLATLHDQLIHGKTHGCAVGRNIFQRSLPEALALTHAINALVYHQASLDDAQSIYRNHLT